MELSQRIFRNFYAFYRRLLQGNQHEEELKTAKLEVIQPRLLLLARMLTGAPIHLLPASREGGWKGTKFFLPQSYGRYPSLQANLDYYLFRVFYLSVQRQMKYNWKEKSGHTIEDSQAKSLKHADEILSQLFLEYSGTRNVYDQLSKYEKELTKEENTDHFDGSWLYGRWMLAEEKVANKPQLEQIGKSKKEGAEHAIQTEIKAKPVDEIEIVTVDKKAIEDYVLTHNFEKVDTADEFAGNWRHMDGEDELKSHEEALSELNLKHAVRVDDTVHSIYQADFMGNSNIPDSATVIDSSFHYQYPEWDYRNRKYRENYCKVYPEIAKEGSDDYYRKAVHGNRKAILELRKMFSQVHNMLEKKRHLNHGDLIDLDAVIDAYAGIIGRKHTTDKLYISQRKKSKDLSILFLLDSSLSSDGFTGGKRVLDIARESVIVFGEILEEFGVQFQIDTFNSKTRNYCHYQTLKSFGEAWKTSRTKVGGLSAMGYTRIGPALRHAGYLMSKVNSRRRWIVLLSDGKPNDYDRYEGKYGLEDVKKALFELEISGISTFALAIEAQARYYLPQMFGHHNYNILPDPSRLPLAFAQFYKNALSI